MHFPRETHRRYKVHRTACLLNKIMLKFRPLTTGLKILSQFYTASYGEFIRWVFLSNRNLSLEMCLIDFTTPSLLEVRSNGFHCTVVS
jgi:hypothetical protein